MAKHNAVFGTLSGKIGNIVFFRRRGRQVERVLVPSPTDPRTLKQGVVRARFANNKNLWRLLLPYVGVAWRHVSRYGYGGNAFYKHNISNMPTCSLDMSRDGNALPNLGPVTYGGLQLPYTLSLLSYSSRQYLTNILVPRTGNDAVSSFSAHVLENNVSLLEGDIIHLLGISCNADAAQLSPSTTNAFATQIYHTAIKLDKSDYTSMSLLLRNFSLGYGSIVEDLSPIVFTLNLSPPAADYDSDRVLCAMAMFIERPSRPPRSRFTRCSWVLDADSYNSLEAACASGNVANSFGITFTSI